MDFFSIDHIFFSVLGYDMSYLEFAGVLTGLIAIGLSAIAHLWSWPIGIANVILSFFLYYQIQLYPDMFLQVFFLITNLTGWWRWANPKAHEADRKQELQVSYLGWKKFAIFSIVGMAGTLALGAVAARLHEWFPVVFALPSAFPYADSFLLVMSIITTFLMIEKKIESWIIWIIVDMVATVLYFVKGIKFYEFEYLLFTGTAAFGLVHWLQEYNQYKKQQQA
jgi:nicotinamide mononucleotide transporter